MECHVRVSAPRFLRRGAGGLTLILLIAFGPAGAEAAGAPQFGATWATAITSSSAALHAGVDPGGVATNLRFQYLTGSAYEANLGAGREAFSGAAQIPGGAGAPLGSGEAVVESLERLGGLAPETEYVFRAVATNLDGTTDGPARSFLTRETTPDFGLPDDRGWELVSPAEKGGGAVQGPGQNFGGDVLQAAAQGDAITYSSSSSFGAAVGAPFASQYVSSLKGPGWSTEDVTPPTISGAYGDDPQGVPYQLFSEDLSRALMLGGARCGEGERCPRSYDLLEPPGIVSSETPAEPDLRIAGATPDLRHVVLSTCAALTSEAVEEPEGSSCDPADTNLYEWAGGAISLLNASRGEILPAPFATLAAPAGAISNDGRRVYWSQVGSGRLWLAEPGGPQRPVAGGQGEATEFQAASADGGVAYFTEGLAGARTLYRYQLASESSSLVATGVRGVLGASTDGGAVYYQTQTGLFRWSAGSTTEIAAGSDAADESNWPPATGTARVGVGGSRLVFISDAELTGYENVGLSEVYLYDAAAEGGRGELVCASCNPSGERPIGPSSIPGAIPDGEGAGAVDSYKPRDFSASGDRLFFDSSDALAVQDTDRAEDVYEWEADGSGTCARAPGCTSLISSGRSEGGASFVDASESGADVFFLTTTSLTPSDPGSQDVYDAREGGGFPEPTTPLTCFGDACQPLPSPPEDPTPGTLSGGTGNPALTEAKPTHKRKHNKKKARPPHKKKSAGHHSQNKHIGGHR